MTWLELAAYDAKARFLEMALLAGYRLDPEKIGVQVLAAPHKQTSLPPGTMALYSFWLGQQACKVGIASPNDDARFRHHHYSPNSCGSSLARSVRNAPQRIGLKAPPTDSRAWLERQLSRINFILPAAWGQPVLKLFEAFLHARWRPAYEGRAWKGFEDALPAPDLEPCACPGAQRAAFAGRRGGAPSRCSGAGA